MIAKNSSALILLGATFEPISEDQKSKLAMDHGLQIKKLGDGKFRNAGVKEGFIITKVDKKPIRSSDDLSTAFGTKRGGVLIEGVYPNGVQAYYGFGI